MNLPPETTSFREVALDVLPVMAQQRISAYELSPSIQSRAEFSSRMCWATDQLVLQLQAHLLAKRLDEQRVTLRVEAITPWQARKRSVQRLPRIHTIGQLLMAAWTKLFPVKSIVDEQTHTFTVYDSYPEAEIALPALGSPVRLAIRS